MKRILTILILFVCGTASAQVYQRMPQYGYEMQRAKMDSVLQVPGDTVRNKTGVARIGTKLYAGNGTYWTEAGGTTIDTSGIRLRPIAGPGISITGTYPNLTFAGNPDTLTAADPLQLSTVSTKRLRLDFRRDWLDSLLALQVDSSGLLDSALLRNDSLFTYTGGIESYRGKVSGGGTLQEAYDADPAAVPQILGSDEYGNLKMQFQFLDGVGTANFVYLGNTDGAVAVTGVEGQYGSVANAVLYAGNNLGAVHSVTASQSNLVINSSNEEVYLTAPLSNSESETDSSLVIETSGKIKKAAKASGGSGITTAQLTDSLNAREPRYKFRDDSTGNAGYTTLYQRNKLKDSLQANIDLKADTFNQTFTGSLTLSSTTGGITLPSVTQTQMNAIVPALGTQVFNTTYNAVCTYTDGWGWWSIDPAWLSYNGWDSRSEFIATGNNTTATALGDFYSQIANSGTVTSVDGLANRPGIIQLSTATTNNARASLLSAIVGGGTLPMGGGRIMFQADVQVPTLSSSTETFRFFTGFTSNAQTVSASSIAFLYDSAGVNAGSAASGRWQVVCSNGTTKSYTTTDSTVMAGAWYRLRAVVNATATSVEFYINGALVKTETNSIPTAVLTPAAVLTKSAGTTARTVLIDLIRMRQKFTNPR